ncbi:MAG: MarR family transcriptional regulator [Lachnospiraceae bacterium]|jgi:DNA-binding MarR family transcriptional regulator|nr:MarR family transcriptional regulator [Lachnospiraceae bacterium]
MDRYQTINDVLVTLFNDILDIEEKALIIEEFQDISINDMHVMEAVGLQEPKNMSTVAKALSVTVGTLTIAVNSLVKKGYVERVRSVEDRRVVLLSLTEKGRRAYAHHQRFHENMVHAVVERLEDQELEVLVKALRYLEDYFRSI